MRRSRSVAGAGVALFLCASLAAAASGSLRAHTQADPASRAIEYLQAQQSPKDGSIPSSPGSYAASELYAIGAAAAGYDPNAMHAASGPSVIAYLAAHAHDACSSAGRCGELIQAVVAAGHDPHAFAGLDLVASLMTQYRGASGAFGDGEAFTQALAVQGLIAAGAPVPPHAIHYVLQAQDSDGGWDWLDVRNDPNPNDFASSDTNSTAMSLMALDAAGIHQTDASALQWLRAQQDGDGGFPYQAGWGSDPDSTALVVQAVLAAGQDPMSLGWSEGGVSPLSELQRTQDASGGYTFPGNAAPDPFTTSQVPLALLEQPLPARGTFAGGFTPGSEAHAALTALLYLQSKQDVSGGFTGVSGSFDPSELYAIGAAAAGYDPKTLRHSGGAGVMTYLAANAAAACATAGQCGRLIEAVVAADLDPHAFAGRDLLAAMLHFYDARTGAFGDGEAFAQTLALQGLVAAGMTPPSAAVAYLRNAQDSDGGWNYLDNKDDPNPNDFASSDTNSTAMALMALGAAGDHTRDASALAWLHHEQDADGGFGYQAGSGSDPDSTALVLQALDATGQDAASPQWSIAGRTAISALVRMQASGGGYTFPGNTAPDAFTTAQVPVALERVAFPVSFGARAFYTPGHALNGPRAPATPSPPARPSPPAGLVTPAPTSAVRQSDSGTSAAATQQPRAAPGTREPTPAQPTSQVQAIASPSPHSAPPIANVPVSPVLPAPLVYAGAALAAALLTGAGGWLVVRRR